MRKIGMSFKQIYKLTKRFFKKIEYKEKKNKQRSRPRKYKDEFIITIFLYQTLKQYSYREVLQELKYLGFKTPYLNDYHYRIKQLNENILKLLLEKTGQHFIKKIKDKIQYYIADATGFAITLNGEEEYWNFYMILIYVFLFILSVLIFRRIFLIFGTGSLYISRFLNINHGLRRLEG
jgi:hypothetical protein